MCMLYVRLRVLFYPTGLQSTDKIPGDALKSEQELNEDSLMALKSYYRSLRLATLLISGFLLDSIPIWPAGNST